MSLSEMVESPRQPDVIKEFCNTQKNGRCLWLFDIFSSAPRADGRAVSYSRTSLSHTEPEKHIIKA